VYLVFGIDVLRVRPGLQDPKDRRIATKDGPASQGASTQYFEPLRLALGIDGQAIGKGSPRINPNSPEIHAKTSYFKV